MVGKLSVDYYLSLPFNIKLIDEFYQMLDVRC